MQRGKTALILLIISIGFNYSLLANRPLHFVQNVLYNSRAKVAQQNFVQNNILYPEISKQFFKVAESSRESNAYETEKYILKLCKLLLKQRYEFWKMDGKNMPLYIKLHDEKKVPLPSTKLHKVEFVEDLKVTGSSIATYSLSALNCEPIPLQRPECIDTVQRDYTPTKIESQTPYHIKLSPKLLNKPIQLLLVLLHEITHLEQFNNALALTTYSTKRYGLGLEHFYPFYPAYTNTYSEQVYQKLERDKILQFLSASLLTSLQPNTYDQKTVLSRIAQALSPHPLNSSLEAEADLSCYLFMHNPYLMFSHFWDMRPFKYDPQLILRGYDPDRSGSIQKYAQHYYRIFPERLVEHMEEYKRLKPFLTKKL